MRGPLLPEPVGQGRRLLPGDPGRGPRQHGSTHKAIPTYEEAGYPPERPAAGSFRLARGSVVLALRASGAVGQSASSRRYGSHPTGLPRRPVRARGPGAAPACGPLRPAPGPAPPKLPQAYPFHALTRPPLRRTRGRPPARTGAPTQTSHQPPHPDTETPAAQRTTSPSPPRRPAPEPARRRGGKEGWMKRRGAGAGQGHASGGGAKTPGWMGRRSRVLTESWRAW